jgi:hypothetical protein
MSWRGYKKKGEATRLVRDSTRLTGKAKYDQGIK